MTRKLENLDSATLDRISGGCKPVAQQAGPAFKLSPKLGSVMDVAVMPAHFADIHEAHLPDVSSLIPAGHDIHGANLPDVSSLIPAAHDILNHASDVQILDSTQLGSGLDIQQLPGADAIQDLPDNWCGTPDQNVWDDDVDQPMADAPDADATATGHFDLDDMSDWSPVIGHSVEQPVAPPTMRDHRAAAIAAADAPAPVIHDHRTTGDSAGVDQPHVRDQR